MENPILFIDMSYYIFHRFYALKSWYKRSQETELDIENVINNELFIQKFHKLFIENIKKIQKTLFMWLQLIMELKRIF